MVLRIDRCCTESLALQALRALTQCAAIGCCLDSHAPTRRRARWFRSLRSCCCPTCQAHTWWRPTSDAAWRCTLLTSGRWCRRCPEAMLSRQRASWRRWSSPSGDAR
eukprot:365291-Chlamydomonas_euryale.AAC.4